MVVIGFYDFAKSDGWRLKLSQHLSRFKIVDLMSKEGQLADIALVWAHPMGCFSSMPNLKGIINRGQGVDHILSDKSIPRDIPLVRLVDHDMSEALSHWVILSALNFWRDADYYRSCQSCQIWKPLEQRPVDKA